MESKLTRALKMISVTGIICMFAAFLVLQHTHRDPDSPRSFSTMILDGGGAAYRMLADGSYEHVNVMDDHFVYRDAQTDEIVTIVLTLPDDIGDYDHCVSVFASAQDIGVYINGEQRTYYSDEAYRLGGTYSASRFVVTALTPEDSGGELRITYQTSVPDYTGIYSCPRYGTRDAIIFWILYRYAGQIVSAILLLAVGIIFVISGIGFKYKRMGSKGLGYLGLFSLVMGVWLLCQSNMRVFYGSYLSGMDYMSLYSIMAAPIPLMFFFNSLMKYRYQRSYNVMTLLLLLNIVVCILLEAIFHVDTIRFLLVTHLVIVTSGFVCLVNFRRYSRESQLAQPRAIMVGLAGLVIVVLIEEINLFTVNTFFVGKYLGFGVLFFLLHLGYASIHAIEEQERHYMEAVRASQVKSSFLANMSHEIRTPISTILGMNEMILSQSEDDDITHYAHNISNAGNLLLALVNDILDFTKIEEGKMELVSIRYELRDILNDMICSMGMRAETKGLSLELDLDETTPNCLCGDETRIRRALSNLLSNAVKYTEKGSIKLSLHYVRLSEEELRLELAVSDTGIGIRKEDRKRLFDSFVRLEENRNRSIEGTGLGLSIANHMIQDMGGRIDVKSVYGKGSTFTIYVVQKILDAQPIGRFEEWYRSNAMHPRSYMEQYDATGVRLLVIDDNEMNLEVIRGLLKKTGAVVDTATSGADGLQLLHQGSYHMVLLDHMMPEMDGIETLRRIHGEKPADAPNIPIIALTANVVSGAREEYLRLGFADYLAKPVEYMRLIETMQRFLPDMIQKRSVAYVVGEQDEDFLESRGIHMHDALKYTAGDVRQYVHLLELFTIDKGQGKQALLADVYSHKDWNGYVTYVHGLKNSARMIGADDLADMAYEHECRGREHDRSYVRENYPILIDTWNETINTVLEYLSRRSEHKKVKEGKAPATDEWEETLERAAEYLDIFKKKEALDLLEKLGHFELDAEKRQRLDETVKAVKGYDYEKAISLLRCKS